MSIVFQAGKGRDHELDLLHLGDQVARELELASLELIVGDGLNWRMGLGVRQWLRGLRSRLGGKRAVCCCDGRLLTFSQVLLWLDFLDLVAWTEDLSVVVFVEEVDACNKLPC